MRSRLGVPASVTTSASPACVVHVVPCAPPRPVLRARGRASTYRPDAPRTASPGDGRSRTRFQREAEPWSEATVRRRRRPLRARASAEAHARTPRRVVRSSLTAVPSTSRRAAPLPSGISMRDPGLMRMPAPLTVWRPMSRLVTTTVPAMCWTVAMSARDAGAVGGRSHTHAASAQNVAASAPRPMRHRPRHVRRRTTNRPFGARRLAGSAHVRRIGHLAAAGQLEQLSDLVMAACHHVSGSSFRFRRASVAPTTADLPSLGEAGSGPATPEPPSGTHRGTRAARASGATRPLSRRRPGVARSPGR